MRRAFDKGQVFFFLPCDMLQNQGQLEDHVTTMEDMPSDELLKFVLSFVNFLEYTHNGFVFCLASYSCC